MDNKKTFTIKEIIIIVIITGIIATITTGIITYNNNVKMTSDDALQEFIDAYVSVNDSFYQEIDKDMLIDSAIEGMMGYLDDNYSVFMDNDETEALTEELSGTYEGIGVEISEDNIIKTVFESSPAFTIGLKLEDKIIKVNGIDVSTNTESINIIANSDIIELVVLREQEEMIFTLEKDIIDKPIVTSEIITTDTDKKIGYIYISSFTINVDEQFEKELLKLEEENIESLIIDIRNNTGGYLDKAENIIEMFLDKNDIMYHLSSKDEYETIEDDTSENRNYKIVILQNQASASASEILTGALKDSYGATVVGMTSYGKGKVQQKIESDSGSSIKLTTSEWFRPNKEKVDEVGIEADIIVEHNSELGVDIQKEKAIELLKNEIK